MSAASVTIDGLEFPVKLAGDPALEFCNTFAGWNAGARWDYLQSYEHVAAWAAYVGLLEDERAAVLIEEASRHPRTATRAVRRALDLRAALYEVFTAGSDGPGFDAVSRAVRAAAGELRLVAAPVGARLQIGDGAALDVPAAAVAWSAGQLLVSPDAGIVRSCPGDGCGWLFLDRRGRRRWCSMATCGNRAKARRFADRHA